jgi:uracil-DNA glycosylase family 4
VADAIEAMRRLVDEASGCRSCPLANTRTHVVVGEGAVPSDLMIIGEGPGAREDELGRPFVGRSGALLDRLIHEELGCTRAETYIANVVKCRPPNNRDPLPEEMDACAPWLDRQLALVAPRVIVLLGRIAVGRILGTKASLSSLRGQRFFMDSSTQRPEDGSAIVIPTYHPAYALRGGSARLTEMRVDFARARLILMGDDGANA